VCYNKTVERETTKDERKVNKMRIQYGMTREQVEEMVDSEGWEILSEQDMEENGEAWVDMTILQNDHAVGIALDDEGVYDIQFVPLWAL